MRVTVSVHNDNPNTIWNKLRERLGRDPTSDECRKECHRIMRGDPIPEPKD